MFATLEVRNVFLKGQPRIKKALDFLNLLHLETSKDEIAQFNQALLQMEAESRFARDEVHNELYILKRCVGLLTSYLELWDRIVNKEFASSWDSLQDCLDSLRTLKRFLSANGYEPLKCFEIQLRELEKLYPYGLFFSIAATVDSFECSICGEDIDSFDCSHLRGELYRGQIAYGIARNISALDHVAVVTNPADKRCVPQYKNDGEQFKLVRFLSDLICSRKIEPLAFGELRFSKRRMKNAEFRKVPRNAPCYCGSGKKFKRCCSTREFVEQDHVDIIAKQVDVAQVFGNS